MSDLLSCHFLKVLVAELPMLIKSGPCIKVYTVESEISGVCMPFELNVVQKMTD